MSLRFIPSTLFSCFLTCIYYFQDPIIYHLKDLSIAGKKLNNSVLAINVLFISTVINRWRIVPAWRVSLHLSCYRCVHEFPLFICKRKPKLALRDQNLAASHRQGFLMTRTLVTLRDSSISRNKCKIGDK